MIIGLGNTRKSVTTFDWTLDILQCLHMPIPVQLLRNFKSAKFLDNFHTTVRMYIANVVLEF